MAVGEQFSLSWNEFHKNLSSGFHSLFEDSSLVDVTLAAEGRKIQAHRVVLSVCSPYFKEMFSGNPCQHPIVFLKDVSFLALKNLLQFMYQGEVNVRQEDLPDFIKTAEQLQVKGLTGGSTKESADNASNNSTASQSSTWSNSRNVNRVKSTPSPVPSQVTRKQSSIASKRQKNSPSTAIHPAKRPYVEISESSMTQEPEEVNLPSGDMIATLKLEPEESYVINSDDPLPDDPKLNDSDFPADAVLQELDDEPQAGTSMMMGDSKDAVTQELIRYTTSPRGNVQIIVSDYLYNKERAIGPKTFWRCPLYKVSKQGCRGSLVTSQRNVVIIEGHNHRPDFATISRKDINRVIVLNKV